MFVLLRRYTLNTMNEKTGTGMKKYEKRRSILGLVLTLSTLLYYIEQAVSDEARQQGADIYTVGEFINEFHFKKERSSLDAVFLRQKDGAAYLRLREFDGISLEHAKSYFSDKIYSINSLYREAHSPYPGALSNKISCPDEFKPQRIQRALFDYYLMYANQRLNYGVCLWDLIEYRAIFYPLYCSRNQRFFQIELFVAKDEDISIYQEALQKLACE